MNNQWSPQEVEQILLWGRLDAEWQRDSTPPDRKDEIAFACSRIACDLGDGNPLGRRERMRGYVACVRSALENTRPPQAFE